MNLIRKMVSSYLIFAAVMTFSLFSGSVALADEIKYIYYPSSEVYFNPTGKVYYYQDKTVWVERPVAPVGINLGKGVSVTLGGTTPYTYHTQVIKQYPRTYIIKD